MSVLRSVGAVLAGLVFIVASSLLTDVAMHATGIFPPWFQPMSHPLWALAIGYRIVYGIIGCYIAARLAPDRPMLHAWILGGIGVLLSLMGVAMVWDKGPEYGPKWYAVAIVLISIPCAWIGGKLGAESSKN